MKKTILCICCLISINTLSQTVAKQVKDKLGQAMVNRSFKHYSIDYELFDNRHTITEDELDSIFQMQKKYYGITEDSYSAILSGTNAVYSMTNNPTLKREIIYFTEKAINDTIVRYAGNCIKRADLHIFNKRMKDEIIKNLNFSYKDLSSHRMLNENMILLAGALEMNEIKDRLQIIADSSSIYSDCKNAARIALCRMGDKRMLKEYFGKIESMRLQDVASKYIEIEYIKQKESVDILLKILYSEETEPSPKETLPDDKLAWYAMMVIKRISTNCPIDVENIYSREQKDKCLAEMRRWAKTNKIKLNRETW